MNAVDLHVDLNGRQTVWWTGEHEFAILQKERFVSQDVFTYNPNPVNLDDHPSTTNQNEKVKVAMPPEDSGNNPNLVDLGNSPSNNELGEQIKVPTAPPALVVCSKLSLVQPVVDILTNAQIDVYVEATAEAAIETLKKQPFGYLLINASDSEGWSVLIDRFRYQAPNGRVRLFATPLDLLSNDPIVEQCFSLTQKNSALLSLLLDSEDDPLSLSAHQVAKYADRVCRSLALPVQERLLISTAAFVDNLIRTGLQSNIDMSQPNLSDTVVKALKMHGYPPIVMRMVQLAHLETTEHREEQLPLDVLGASVIRVLKQFLEQNPDVEELSAARFDRIVDSLHAVSESYSQTMVADALSKVLKHDIVSGGNRHGCRVVIFNMSGKDHLCLENCLNNLGYDVCFTDRPDEVVERGISNNMDILMIQDSGRAAVIIDLIYRLNSLGVSYNNTPTFLLVDDEVSNALSSLLKMGIEDIFRYSDDIDSLLLKIERVRVRRESEIQQHVNMLQRAGTHGTLDDMNVIDLLQMLGQSQKTVRLNITGCAHQLTIFLDNGALIYAECDEFYGAEAVNQGISWKSGIWSVDPINREDLPEPNNSRSIDSILLEACQLLDEMSRESTGI